MGYTHCWIRKPELDNLKFALFADDCKQIIAESERMRIKIGNSVGEGFPLITESEVAFNGSKSQEAFHVPQAMDIQGRHCDDRYPGMYFESITTKHLPYDLTVTACLIALKHIFNDGVQIYSDGESSDWIDGKLMCKFLFGYGLEFKLDDE